MGIELPESFRERASKSWQTVVPLLMVVVLICFITASPRTTAARNATQPVDPALLATVYSAPVDKQKILSFKKNENDKFTVRIAADQLVVTLKPGKSPADARALAEFLGGAVIGQVPRRRVYQLQVSSRSKEELDALLTRARTHPAVYRAGYNSLVEFQECPAPSDNHDNIRGRHRCAFEDIEYYTALTFFESARTDLPTLSQVSIAVLDSGLDQTNLEFHGLKLLNLNQQGEEWEPLTDPSSIDHGTKVTSLIAAANDDRSINGISSRFLGPQLTLLCGDIFAEFDVDVMVDRAALAGADIVNMSFIPPGRGQDEYVDLFESYPEILFVTVVDADYDRERGIICETLRPPAGISLDNVIIVGGMLACILTPFLSCDDLSLLATDIRAPAENIPVLTSDYGIEYVTGNSFAAPMVTSLAAILKSLNPELSPREIKTYIQAESMLFGANLTFRLAMLRSIVWLLMDMDVDPLVRDWIDPRGGLPVPPPSPLPGRIIGNVCGNIVISVDGADYQRPRPFGVYGAITPDHTTIQMNFDQETRGEFNMHLPLEPEETYDLVEDNEESPDGVEFSLSDVGHAVSGQLIITEDCWITERFPDTNEPLVVNLFGRFDGVVEDRHHIQREFEGLFANIPFSMALQMRGHPLLRYFENNCAGGIGH